jgi:hypothetical protein
MALATVIGWPVGPARAADLSAAVEQATADAQGRGTQVGIAVLDQDTGRWYENGAGAHTQMRSASIPKILVAESLLDRARQGLIVLTSRDRALMEVMVTRSDDAAMSDLYSRFGGLDMIVSVVQKYGLSEIGGPPTPSYWGMYQITAHDIVRFYDGMMNGGLQPQDRDYLLSLMRAATPTGTDGFNQYSGIPHALPNQVWGVKQGWMCCQEGQRRLHTTGVLGADNRFLVAVLSQSPQSVSYARAGETLTQVVSTLFPGGVVPPSETARNPFGTVEVVRERSAGIVQVRGWATDPDAPAAPVDVHVYVDGQFAGVTQASRDRPDVAAALPGYSSAHGFDLDVTVGGDGVHQVCSYAINLGAGTTNPLLGCSAVPVRVSPVGNVDVLRVVGLRTIVVGGWSIDPDRPTTPTDAHLYVDGVGALVTTAAADRPDVGAAFPGVGSAHGLDIRLTLATLGRQRVCVYAINVPGSPGTNPALGCGLVDVPSAFLGQFEAADLVPGGTRLRGWVIDPAHAHLPSAVHVYSDGVFVGQLPAGATRGDVGQVYPEGGSGHGFEATVASTPGRHQVCVYAIYSDQRAANPLLGCRVTG